MGELQQDISGLLHRLNSADSGAAWAEFIDRYTPRIMNLVSQFEYQQERGHECFLYVCEKLCEHRFRRLQKFKVHGKASFQTWLGAVVFNLCVDWHRSEFGRVQMLPAVSALPAFDRKVYQLSFKQGMPLETCFQTLKADFPDLTRQQLSSAMGRVYNTLTPRQRWRINVRIRQRKPGKTDPCLLPSLETGPEDGARLRQESADLQLALSKLSQDQRLLIQLRFRQGLTLKKIAEVMQLGDPFRARRELQTALDLLSDYMKVRYSTGRE